MVPSFRHVIHRQLSAIDPLNVFASELDRVVFLYYDRQRPNACFSHLAETHVHATLESEVPPGFDPETAPWFGRATEEEYRVIVHLGWRNVGNRLQRPEREGAALLAYRYDSARLSRSDRLRTRQDSVAASTKVIDSSRISQSTRQNVEGLRSNGQPNVRWLACIRLFCQHICPLLL